MFSVVVLISGSGSNLLALLKASENPLYPAKIVAVGGKPEQREWHFQKRRSLHNMSAHYGGKRQMYKNVSHDKTEMNDLVS